MILNKTLAQVARVRAIALDLDGVVYQGAQALPGAVAGVGLLRRLGFKVYFVTNNSAKTRVEVARKITQMGIIAGQDDVLTSGYAAAFLVSRLMREGNRRVLVLGSESLKSDMVQTGVEIVTAAPCDFLVVGLDTGLTYEKICVALDALLNGALFIACNLDPVFPTEGGRLLPGCGPEVAALQVASARKPDHVAGKPNTLLLEILAENDKLLPDQILVIGDGLESDIAMANKYGSLSVLVTQTQDFSRSGELRRSEQLPGLVVESLYEFARLMEAGCSTWIHK